MALSTILLLGVVFWIVISGFKHWYNSRMKIEYTHKIDEKLLAEMRKPSAKALEKLAKLRRERGFMDEPQIDPSKISKDDSNKERKDKAESENKSSDQQGSAKKQQRPLTLFEEMDMLLKEKRAKKKNTGKYDKSMFEDPLTRLYRDIQNEKKKQSTADTKATSQTK